MNVEPIERELTLQAQYLPGVENLRADRELLVMRDCSDWMMSPVNCEVIYNYSLGDQPICIPLILPATSLLQLDTTPLITNDFVQDWEGLKAYENPL